MCILKAINENNQHNAYYDRNLQLPGAISDKKVTSAIVNYDCSMLIWKVIFFIILKNALIGRRRWRLCFFVEPDKLFSFVICLGSVRPLHDWQLFIQSLSSPLNASRSRSSNVLMREEWYNWAPLFGCFKHMFKARVDYKTGRPNAHELASIW